MKKYLDEFLRWRTFKSKKISWDDLNRVDSLILMSTIILYLLMYPLIPTFVKGLGAKEVADSFNKIEFIFSLIYFLRFTSMCQRYPYGTISDSAIFLDYVLVVVSAIAFGRIVFAIALLFAGILTFVFSIIKIIFDWRPLKKYDVFKDMISYLDREEYLYYLFHVNRTFINSQRTKLFLTSLSLDHVDEQLAEYCRQLNVWSLCLRNNNLKTFDFAPFSTLPNLLEIDLSFNQISEVVNFDKLITERRNFHTIHDEFPESRRYFFSLNLKHNSLSSDTISEIKSTKKRLLKIDELFIICFDRDGLNSA